ncbi:MAG TPA: DUF5915 domain-containing protein, partial [Caulifigura sp.]|nr:DUF5915 domain-containing protein [Caulifigura sp.]
LSNWYIRRNRRRFWRSRTETEASGGRQPPDAPANPSAWEPDKLAAYQTLYETLVALTKLLAPAIPFLAERMYQNLVVGVRAQGAEGSGSPESVHLCEYPTVDSSLLDESLNHRMATAQRVVSMGHRLRESADRRVRQPLAELKYACTSQQDADDIERLKDVIADELNVKTITREPNLDRLVHYLYKPNLKTLGPKLGKLLNAVKTVLPNLPEQIMAPLRKGETVTLKVNGEQVVLAPEDVMVSTEQASDWAAADDAGVQIALSTLLTPELMREGAARDFIRQVQQLRKDHDLEENDRIAITWQSADTEVAAAIEEWRETILNETRAATITQGATEAKPVTIGSTDVQLAIARTTT